MSSTISNVNEAVTSLCWQRSKPVLVNENNCTAETALLGGAVEDSILMPDPLPSVTSSSLSTSIMTAGSRNPGRSGPSVESSSMLATSSGFMLSSLHPSTTEETPLFGTLWTGGNLTRLHAPRNYNFKDDIEVFSPLVEVQRITPSLDKLWDQHEGAKKDHLRVDKKPSLLFPSSNRRFPLSEEGGGSDHPIFDWKPSSTSKQGGVSQPPRIPSQPHTQQGSSFTLQLFQRTLEETLGSFQKSIHEDMRNLHIEILRQFHMQEMEMSGVMSSILENQVEIMKEVQSLRKETQQLRQLL